MEQQPNTCNLSVSNLIYSYTRAQAIADGRLVDVSVVAREAGFRVPVAMAAAAWAVRTLRQPGLD